MSEAMEFEPLEELEVARLAAQVAERGYAVAENLIPDELREALVEGIDRAMHEFEIPYGDNEFLGHCTRRIFNLLARDRLFETTPTFCRTLPVIERVLDDECLLSSLTAIEMNPGQARQPLHADDGSYGFPRPSPTFVALAIWALTDFTAENGGTHIVPGSQGRDRRPNRGDEVDAIQVEMPAGSVLFYNGSIWHGGGENRTDARRVGIVNNYCAGFLRQEESQILALSRERVAAFEPRLRRLVGYGTYRGLIGHVDQRSPEALVDPEIDSDMVWKRIHR
ncbi:MAG: phytanoyl-CoA dioxygenase [bacterium]|nr:phytanoyl-CoA dioxygenase [Deltaproteobacteria bacterium]MCP4904331.1 phytanoyl-CoA dioxygenase [bacterium]